MVRIDVMSKETIYPSSLSDMIEVHIAIVVLVLGPSNVIVKWTTCMRDKCHSSVIVNYPVSFKIVENCTWLLMIVARSNHLVHLDHPILVVNPHIPQCFGIYPEITVIQDELDLMHSRCRIVWQVNVVATRSIERTPKLTIYVDIQISVKRVMNIGAFNIKLSIRPHWCEVSELGIVYMVVGMVLLGNHNLLQLGDV